ncbi:MAG: hypothetical protein IK095_00280 [Oscillospiraceae bacterium]|nr:hypothetical protein [Oscillospiraceae bacterium]
MPGRAPLCHNCLVFRREGPDRILILDYAHQTAYEADYAAARFLRRLDGRTDPYTIDPSFSRGEVDELLEELEALQLLRHGPVLERSFGTICLTLWRVRPTRRLRALGRAWNALLGALWAPVFTLGLLLFLRDLPMGGSDRLLPGYLLGLLPGLLLHELGHLMAALAYGAHVFEMGVMIRNFLPGAYVSMDPSPVRSSLRRAQIDAAGLEAQALLTGLFLCLACAFPSHGCSFFCAAMANVTMVLINSGTAAGMDGGEILAELLGCPDLVARSRRLLRSRRLRRELWESDPDAPAILALCALVQALRAGLPLALIWSSLEVIGWIVG